MSPPPSAVGAESRSSRSIAIRSVRWGQQEPKIVAGRVRLIPDNVACGIEGERRIEDIYDVIEWLATQPWCDGQVATFGTSYFAMTAKRVAMLKPPSLRTIFAPFGVTDEYRPWSIHHPHDLREPLKPGEIYEFNIEIVPTGYC